MKTPLKKSRKHFYETLTTELDAWRVFCGGDKRGGNTRHITLPESSWL